MVECELSAILDFFLKTTTNFVNRLTLIQNETIRVLIGCKPLSHRTKKAHSAMNASHLTTFRFVVRLLIAKQNRENFNFSNGTMHFGNVSMLTPLRHVYYVTVLRTFFELLKKQK